MTDRVDLTEGELYVAALVGIRRRIAAIVSGGRIVDHRISKSPWEIDVEGACGEFVVAKLRGLHWYGGEAGVLTQTDVGPLQVRTSAYRRGLTIRPTDDPNEVFVFVSGQAPSYEGVGWLFARDAMRPEYLTEDGRTWQVPPNHLAPLASLDRDAIDRLNSWRA